MILSVVIFTSCSEPKPYTGKFYNTEYVTNISDAEYNENWERTNWEIRSKHLATWPSKSGYEKKTNFELDGRRYIDTDDSRECTLPLDVQIPLTKELVHSLYTEYENRDVILDYVIDYFK